MTSTPASSTSSRRKLLATGLALAGAAALPAAAATPASDFPSRPITLVVPFPPGGSVDAMARLYSESLGRVLGTPIVVGLSNGNPAWVLQGGIFTAWLALLADRALRLLAPARPGL